MEFRLVLRGLSAGGLAGLVAFAFARVFAEPVTARAIDYEEGRRAAEHSLAGPMGDMNHGAEIFSRSVQQNIGSGVGMVLFGLAMGALFAVVYCVCVGRVGQLRPRTLAILVAAAMFGALYLAPFLKYPANPPGIGNPETIQERTGLYLSMVVASVALAVAAVLLGRFLAPRLGGWNATLIAAGAFAIAAGVVMVLLPSFAELAVNRGSSETPAAVRAADGRIVFPGFPADDLYLFRLCAVATQAILWTVIGVLFAPMAQRVLEPKTP